MQRGDERVVDHLDLWVVNDFGVCLVNLFDATLCRECLGSESVAGGHGDQPVTEHTLEGSTIPLSATRAAPRCRS
jgi:hypothetical protein